MNNHTKGLPYTGSKYKLLDQLLPLFSENIENFIEPFLGGCNIAQNIKAEKYFLNDKLGKLVFLYHIFKCYDPKSIIDKIESKISYYSLNKSNKESYLYFREQYNLFPNNSYSSSIELLILLYFSFSNHIRFNNKGKFNVPFGQREFHEQHKRNLIKLINFFQYKKQDIFLTGFLFNDFLKNILKSSDINKEKSFIYLDPPYFNTTATYNENNWNIKDEEKLMDYIEKIIKLNIKFGLSNVFKNNEPISEPLKDLLNKYSDILKVHFLDKNYSNCNYQRKENKLQEIFICNY